MEVMRDMLAPLSPDTRAGLGALDSSDEGSDEGQGGVEFKLEANAALKDILTDPSERALFLSNLGKVNVEALLGSSPDLASFPDMQGQIFEGPALFITGEREPVWGGDSEVLSLITSTSITTSITPITSTTNNYHFPGAQYQDPLP